MVRFTSTNVDDFQPRHAILTDFYNLCLAVRRCRGKRSGDGLSPQGSQMLGEFLERASPALAARARDGGWTQTDSALRFVTQEGGLVRSIVRAYLQGAITVTLMDQFLQDDLGPRFLSIHRVPHVKGLRSAFVGLGQLREKRRENRESEAESAPERSGGGWVEVAPRWPIRNPIERVMAERKWSLRRLAKETGVEYAYLRSLKEGRKGDLGLNTAERLAKVSLARGSTPARKTEVSWAATGMQEEYFLSRQSFQLEWLTTCEPDMTYGLPEIAVLCYETWLALVDLIFCHFTIRRCARIPCGRVFIPTPRASSHHHYCSTKCRSRQRYMSSPYRRGRQDR